MTDIETILKTYKTIAVVGLSPKSHRASHRVSEYMKSQGYRMCWVKKPIHP
jgi:predicted CoA-binding protein